MSLLTVALVGPPNSGKTTLYNWLTGSNSRIVNYPGSTVEIGVGKCAAHWSKANIQFIDSPGTYSLQPKAEDEQVTSQLLSQGRRGIKPQIVLSVIDGTQLERHLPLLLQLKKTGYPLLVAVTMSDLLERQNLKFDWLELSKILNAKIFLINGILGGGLKSLIVELESSATATYPAFVMGTDFNPQREARESHEIYRLLSHKVLDLAAKTKSIAAKTKKFDRFLLHPIYGALIFLAIMGGLFSSIFTLAKPMTDVVESGFHFLQAFKFWESIPFGIGLFISEGLLEAFKSVLVFVPQIFILFFGIGVLEATGYLARAAAWVDAPLSKLGLTGRSFVPLLSGFSCAVPGIMSARNISSKRDRFITIFILPLMTCSARLPVYALLLGFLFLDQPAWKAGLSLTALYLFSILIGGIAALILHRLLPKTERSVLMMELPLLRKPKWWFVARQSMKRTKTYIYKAGPIIFFISLLLWVGLHFPKGENLTPTQQVEQSAVGRFGKFIEPAMKPLEVDWRVGISFLSAFAAREVFIPSLALVMGITDNIEENTQPLWQRMGTAKNAEGKPLFTVASILGIIVFFTIALQCLSTVSVAIKEFGHWKYAIGQLVLFNVVAYLLAVVVVQSVKLIS